MEIQVLASDRNKNVPQWQVKYWYTWKLFKALCYTFKSFVEEEFNEYYLLMSRYSWNTAKGGVKHQFRQSKTICCTIKIRYKATTGWFNSATVGHFCFYCQSVLIVCQYALSVSTYWQSVHIVSQYLLSVSTYCQSVLEHKFHM
jgi:hypothetical protein